LLARVDLISRGTAATKLGALCKAGEVVRRSHPDHTCASVLSPEAARELGRVRSRRPTCAAAGQALAFFGLARIATSVRDSRATVHGGSERFQAVGEAGLRPASLLLDPASLLAMRVVSGGGGIRTPEAP
jgi:hypothetical protein